MNALKGTLIKVSGRFHIGCCAFSPRGTRRVVAMDAWITVDGFLSWAWPVGEARAPQGRSISNVSLTNDSIPRFQDRKLARR